MGAELRPYPRMKDSGVEWLGEVPEHWGVRRLGQIGSFFKGHGGTKADEIADGVPCVRYGDLYTRHRFFVTDSRACVSPEAAAEKYTSIRYGDVLFAGSGETLGEIGKSAVNLLSGRTCCGGDVIVFRPSIAADARFLGYAADSPAANSQKARLGRGLTVMHIYSNDLKYLSIGMPPPSEQRAIARFLDHADRRIQSYIRTKERLIELLEEQRQAIIHQAVTGQIDVRTGQPYPAYKDSGVEWLGEVPEHWALSRVKGEFQCLNRKRVPLSSVERGKMTSRRYDYYGASGIIDKVDDYLFDDELLLIAEDGANLVMRNLPLAIVARGRFWVNNHAHILKPKRGNIEFLAWMMEGLSYLPWISGAAQPKLTQDRLMGIAIAVPPRDEQDEVMASLKDETVQLTDAVTHARQQIALIREYRIRLVADVVTGKLDVRAAATALPDGDPLGANDTDEVSEGYAELAAATLEPHP